MEVETDSDKGVSRTCPYTLTQRQEGSRGLMADLQRVSRGRRVLSSPTFHWPGQLPSQRRDLTFCGQLTLKHERRALPASPNRHPPL